MTRERVARIALRAYPPCVRDSDADEMLGTLLDLSDGSTAALLRESWLLVLAGLRRRAQTTAVLGIRRLGADAACAAATLWSMTVLWAAVMLIVAGFPTNPSVWWSVAAVAPVSLALLGCDRPAGACGLTWTALSEIYAYPHASGGIRAIVLLARLLPIVCFSVMVLAPRARPLDPRRLLWLAGVITVAVVWALARGRGSSLDGAAHVQIGALLGLSLVGLVRWPTNPVLAIACGILWTAIGLNYVDSWLQASAGPVQWIELGAAPVVLGASVLRLRALAHLTSG